MNNIYTVQNDHGDVDNLFIELEKFTSRGYFLRTKPFDNFTKTSLTDLRFIYLMFIKLLTVIFFIRCIVIIAFPTPLIRDITCNAYHYLGDPILLCMVFIGGIVTINLSIGGYFQYLNFTGKSFMCKYLGDIKNKRLHYEIHGKYRDKYCRFFKLVVSGVGSQMMPNYIALTVFYCGPTIIGYFDPELNFSLIGVIFWVTVMTYRIWELVSAFFHIFVLWSLCTVHMRFQFEQVTEEILSVISCRELWRLRLLFKIHFRIEQETILLNKELKYYILIFYKLGKQCLNLLIYLIFSPRSGTTLIVIATFEATMISLIIFTINYLCASVATAAHKMQPRLYAVLLAPGHRLPTMIKFKILAFIERLAGPKIGFYCYDLFPMTSYNFADYVMDSMCSYFLIVKLLKKTHLV